MKLEELIEEWEKDCKIDNTALDIESTDKTPQLHHKYLTLLAKENIKYKLLNVKKRNLETQLRDYYSGKIDGKDIGREPWELHETQTAIDKRISSDKEYNKIEVAIIESEEKAKYLKGIVDNINGRSFTIKNAIDWIKWTNGSGI